jgi:hypothetical protein
MRQPETENIELAAARYNLKALRSRKPKNRVRHCRQRIGRPATIAAT